MLGEMNRHSNSRETVIARANEKQQLLRVVDEIEQVMNISIFVFGVQDS